MSYSKFHQLLVAHPYLGGLLKSGALAVRANATAAFDKFIRISFVEGYNGLPPGSLVNRADSVLSAIRRSLETGKPLPYLDTLRAVYSQGELEELFLEENSGLYSMLYNDLRKKDRSAGGARIRSVSVEEIVQSLLWGLDPIDNEPLSRTTGRPLYWYIGGLFQHGGKKGTNRLIVQIKSMGAKNALWVYGDIQRKDAKIQIQEAPQDSDSEQDSGAYLNNLFQEMPDIDLSAVMQDSELSNIVESSVMHRIQDRANHAHGNTDVQYRMVIEMAIWEAMQKYPELFNVDPDTLDFSVKQQELAPIINANTGKESSPKVLGRIFRDTIGHDLKRIFGSESFQRLLDKKIGLAKVYRQEINRRAHLKQASVKRVALRFLQKRGLSLV